MLDWKRFVTFAWASYQQNQIGAIRPFADPRQFITGNFMGYAFDGFDHYTVARSLTFVAWDDYVATGHLDPDKNGISHDTMRGLKRQNFWVIETQPGFVNWSNLNNRSEEHTSELQSRLHLVCRLLLEKKKRAKSTRHITSTSSSLRRPHPSSIRTHPPHSSTRHTPPRSRSCDPCT